MIIFRNKRIKIMTLLVLSNSLSLSQVAFEDEARDNRVIVPRKDSDALQIKTHCLSHPALCFPSKIFAKQLDGIHDIFFL